MSERRLLEVQNRSQCIGESYQLPAVFQRRRVRAYAKPVAILYVDLWETKGLVPAHMVFNGVVGVLQRAGKLKARLGEAASVVRSFANGLP